MMIRKKENAGGSIRFICAASAAGVLLLAGCGRQEADSQEAVHQEADAADPVMTDEYAGEDTHEETGGVTDKENDENTGEETSGTESDTGTEKSEDISDSYDVSLTFAGDINFDENWYTTQYMDTCPNGINDCISPELMEVMNAADIMWINNEFTYSTRGEALEGKAYTFRAAPERAENLRTLGVDIAELANNHVYDYGRDALIDTFDTLESAGIPYVGAGRDLEEAMTPCYFEIDGVRIAYVAASRAEKNKMTPQATETDPGILRCYDTALFDEEIATARENADYVIACVHWGTEYSTDLETVQLETAEEYIDAGADAVIGAHSHCLQGMEFYEGKPVVFSLGNFWFNEKTLDTMLVTLNLRGSGDDMDVSLSITPALQHDCVTNYVSDAAEQRSLYDRLEEISVNVTIDDQGNVTEKY